MVITSDSINHLHVNPLNTFLAPAQQNFTKLELNMSPTQVKTPIWFDLFYCLFDTERDRKHIDQNNLMPAVYTRPENDL